MKAVPPKTEPPVALTHHEALRVLGWTLTFLAFAPPIAVILWRLATHPW